MFLALMDEDGFVQFASVANVAHTARIEENEAEEAIKILEEPDSNSADQDNQGRRIERIPGGWLVLNARKYRDLVTREMVREQTRERVARHRAKLKAVTQGNVDVTHGNETVTPSEVLSEKEKEKEKSRVLERDFSSRRKEKAPFYPKLPPTREPTDAELEAQRKIVREASEKLRKELNR
jgi:hypothetical protein